MSPLADFRDKIRQLTKVSAHNAQLFVLWSHVTAWLNSPSTVHNPTDTNWVQICFAEALDNPPKQLKLELYTKILGILTEIEQPTALILFISKGLTDENLPLSKASLLSVCNNESSERFSSSLIDDFYLVQWRYCPVKLEALMQNHWSSEEVVPIIRKELIGIGKTARVWQVAVPIEFVDQKLANALSWATFEDDDSEIGTGTVSHHVPA
jgi:hypothetical protein